MTKSIKQVTLSPAVLAIRALAYAEFQAFNEFDQAATDRDATLTAIVRAIDYIPGTPASADAVGEFAAVREAYAVGYMESASCDRLAAERAFQRVVVRAGIVKPQTAEAMRKQAVRDAAKSADKANPAGQPVSPSKAIDGTAAAKSVKLELSSIEVHLVNMLRAGKFTQAASLIAEMASAK